MPNAGRNRGVTGLVDLQEEGILTIAGYDPKYQFKVLAFNSSTQSNIRDTRGRGDGYWGGQRMLSAGGNLVLSGEMSLAKWPEPALLRGQTGTVRLTADKQVEAGTTIKNKYVDVPVIITGGTKSRSETSDSNWKITLTAKITNDPTWVGFDSTQPTASDATPKDKELWEGTSKNVDPNGLQTSATRSIDIWGNLDDTDAAEVTRISSAISTATGTPPMTGMQLRTTQFNRTDPYGAVITHNFGLNTTTQDVENESSSVTFDVIGMGRYRYGSVITVGGAFADLSNAAAATFFALKGIEEFENVSVTRLTPTKARHVYEYADQPKWVRGNAWGGRELYRVIKDGGVYKVFLGDRTVYNAAIPRSGALIYAQYMPGVRMRFSIEKKVAGSSVPWEPTKMGTKNNASFLGLATGTVQYLGCNPDVNYAIPANRVSKITYHFLYDSQGIIDDRYVPEGWQILDLDLSGFTPMTWVAASSLLITVPEIPESDFSGFA